MTRWESECDGVCVCVCAYWCECVCVFVWEREREREREKVLEWVFCDEPHRNFLSLFNEAFLPFVVEALDLFLRLSDLTKISICTFQVFFVIPYIGIYFSILPPFSLYLYYPLSVFLYSEAFSLYKILPCSTLFFFCVFLSFSWLNIVLLLSFFRLLSADLIVFSYFLFLFMFMFLFLSNHSCAELNLFIANFVLFHLCSTWIVFLCFTSHLSSSQQLSLSLSSFLSFCSASFLSRWLASSQYFADWPRPGKKLLNPTDYST